MSRQLALTLRDWLGSAAQPGVARPVASAGPPTCAFPNVQANTAYAKGCRCDRCCKRFNCMKCGTPVWLDGTTCIPCRRTPVLDRVMERVATDPNTGCWLWMGVVNQWGYGRVSVGGRNGRLKVVHRVTWEHVNGKVPDGLQLDHLCNTTRCCNPEHLEAVTQAENNRRQRERRAKGKS